MAKSDDKNMVCCSFCGKRQDQVHRMMAGMDNAFICDACIELCAEIMDEEDVDVEADASAAAANSPLYPVLFISGIVTEPEPTVFATDEPETIPSSAEATTATFAGPPEKPPRLSFLRKNIPRTFSA